MAAPLDRIALSRRALLRTAALLAGASAWSLPERFLAAPPPTAAFFDATHAALLEAVSDAMLPRTDSPGAVDAGVPAAFDVLMLRWASAARQAEFRALLDAIDGAARSTAGASFALLPPEGRIRVLAAFDAERIGSDPIYRRFKELLLTLYYLSEAGATRELRYEHVPGAWEPAVPLGPDMRAWAV